MLRKKINANQTSHSPKKRNIIDMGNNLENNAHNVRNNKKMKSGCSHSNSKKENEAGNMKAVAKCQSVTKASSADSIIEHEEGSNEIECVICMNTTEFSDFTHMHCKHSFHTTCIQAWFQIRKSCPVCMKDNCIDSNCFDESAVNNINTFCEGVQCEICMDTEESTHFQFMPCGHKFHAMCIQTWFQHKVICPVCMPYTSVQNASNTVEDDVICDAFNENEEIRCVICLDTVECNEFEFITCCHSFHVVCIRTWFSIRQICPVCMVSNNSNSVGDEDFSQLREQVGCQICMDTEVSSDFKNLICEHSFHTMCVQTWFQINQSCPICMSNTSVDNSSSNMLAIEEEDDEEVKCVICMDTEETSEFQNLSCRHLFHSVCIQNWLRVEKSCPVCRKSVFTNDTFDGMDMDTFDEVDVETISEVNSNTFDETGEDSFDEMDNDTFEEVVYDSFDELANNSFDEVANDLLDEETDSYNEDNHDVYDEADNDSYDDLNTGSVVIDMDLYREQNSDEFDEIDPYYYIDDDCED